MTQRFAFGRQPNDPDKPRLRLAAAPALTPPASADWLSGVTTWGMLANDSVGDCTAAGAGHAAMAFQHYGQQRDIRLTDADALAMYEAVSGYKPSDPSTDVGATLQDALGYWRSTGIAGHKITAFAQIDATNIPLVQACIAFFGVVYTGLNFPSSAMAQFNAGKPWTVVKSQIEGGHCVPIGAYDATGFSCVTWGKAQRLDLKFFRTYFDECWVPISLDWLEANGTAPSGLNTDQLNADYLALTGQPGPFPHGGTPPVVAPPADADHALASAARAWLTAKGL